jgi:hypothetical protein
MKKIDVESFLEMIQEDLLEFEENVNSGTFHNRNAHEWFKLLNDWVEYGFNRRAVDEWQEFDSDED